MGMLVTICLCPMELAIVISIVVIDPGQPVLEEEEGAGWGGELPRRGHPGVNGGSASRS
jgi:hypothetical protein